MLVKLLRRYLKPYKLALLCLIVFQIAQACLNLYLPNLQAEIIDRGVAAGDEHAIYRIGWIMIIIALVQGACNVAAVMISSFLSTRIGFLARKDFFYSVEALSKKETDKYSVDSLITRSTNDVQQVQSATFQAFLFVLQAPVMFIGGLVMAVEQNGPLTWSLALVLPVIMVVVTLIFRKMGPLFRKLQKIFDSLNSVIREQITGVRVIRAFTREGTEDERFGKVNKDTYDLLVPIGFWMGSMGPILWFITSIADVAIMWFGGKLIESGNMPIGALQAFIQYLMIVLMGFMMAAMMSVRLPRASVSSGRLLQVIDDKNSLSFPQDPYRPEAVKGEIEFRDVSFSYPSSDKHDAVEHISFKAKVGETTAFIGATGSGKSTILSLAQRIYDPDEGEVLLDGHSLKEFDPEYLSRFFAPVFQTAKLFTGTIRSNMKFGKEDATDEEIWKALEIAQAKDFVEGFGEGLDYKVSEGGTNFSGGQKQRLCIARAILKGAPVYTFDDAFSALDMATDKKLREALEPVTKDSSMLLVAQRASSIMSAKKIIVLDRGRIVGEGNHEELMESCQTYEQIVASQTGTIQE